MSRTEPRITLPRSWRNNNPGNLRPLSSGMWTGQVDIDRAPGGPFAVFATPVAGFRALARNLRTYQEKHRLYSIAQMINRFAPGSENNTGAYVHAVCEATGWDSDTPYPFTDPLHGGALMAAIARHETGPHPAWSRLDIDEGWRQAFGR